ncbi:MAG: prohibitin family protein [Armatimonadetes bacterium]|nr:prohibitin family protein [Armatimonadota bacterium]
MGLVFFGVLLFVASLFIPRNVGTQNMTGLAWGARVLGVLIAVGGVIGSGVTIVPAGYRGVLLRFGAVSGILSEGIHVIAPTVNTVELVEVRTQKEEATSAAASKDLQTVTATVAINYHVSAEGVGDLFKKVGTDFKKRIIDPATQESVKAVTARYTAEELVRLRDKVKADLYTEVTTRLQPYNIVVEPNGVSITDFTFSEQFIQAIEQKQVAQQTAEKQKYVLQQAKLQADTAVTEAKGKAEAARINGQALNANGGSRVLAREWIDKWDGKLPTVSGGSGSGMIIDVRELMNSGNTEGKAAPAQ